jgi:hypothetical protein
MARHGVREYLSFYLGEINRAPIRTRIQSWQALKLESLALQGRNIFKLLPPPHTPPEKVLLQVRILVGPAPPHTFRMPVDTDRTGMHLRAVLL